MLPEEKTTYIQRLYECKYDEQSQIPLVNTEYIYRKGYKSARSFIFVQIQQTSLTDDAYRE
jgi:hypothetical protein